MAIDILDAKTAMQIINDIESDQNRERRRYEFKQHLCYSGQLDKFVMQKLQKMLPRDSKWMEPVDIRVSKKIVDKLSKAYRMPPKRFVFDKRSNQKNDQKTQRQHKIYSEGKFNNALMHFDNKVNLHKYACLWITKREGKPITAETVPASAVFPIFNQDTGDLEAVVLNYPGTDITHDHLTTSDSNTDKLGRGTSFRGADGINQIIAESRLDSNTTGSTYAMWSETQHAVYEVEKVLAPDGSTKINVNYVAQTQDPELNGVNDLGVIPFVFFSTEPGVELPVENPVTRQTILINCLLSALAAASIRNIGVAKLKRPMDVHVEGLEQGLSTFVDLPQPKNPDDGEVDLSFEVPSHDLQGQLTVALSIMMQVFSEYGIKAGDAIAGQSIAEFASGLERAIAQADVTDLIQMRQMIYEEEVEPKIFEIVKAYLARDGENIFSDNDDIGVIYPKPKVLSSDRETLELLEKRKNMKLISRTGQITTIDPNLTKEEAKRVLEEIDQENAEDSAQGMARFMDNRVVSDEQSQDDSQDGTVDDEDSDDPPQVSRGGDRQLPRGQSRQ